MGRVKCFDDEKYVTFDKSKNISKCLKCKKTLRGKVTGNIKRHYETVHGIYFSDNDVQASSSSASSSAAATRRNNTTIPIYMNKSEFLACCVGLVAAKDISLSIFDDDVYFKKLLNPYEEHFEMNIDSKSILHDINRLANQIKLNISNAVHKKMISLKVDFVRHLHKGIIGINIQYMRDSEIILNTIGMIQLYKTHTAQTLKKEIIDCLKEFKIDMKQVYLCTITDKGADVINIIKQEVAAPFTDDCKYLDIHSALAAVFPPEIVVSCVAHTIEIVSHDVLKTIEPQIEAYTAIVKSFDSQIDNENPTIDNECSWNSTYKMFKSLLNLKGCVEYNTATNIPEVDWRFVHQFLEAFDPLVEFNEKLQAEQYIIGDFYRDWMCCEVELEELQGSANIFAQQLLAAMALTKQSLLFKNDAFIAAIYLDRRFNFLNTPFLNEAQRRTAVRHLLKTVQTIKHLAAQPVSVDSASFDNGPEPAISPTEVFWKLEAKTNRLIEQTRRTDFTMQQKLENLCHAERLPFDTNILEYWWHNQYKDPELTKLIEVALVIPSTQQSVERAYSALSIITEKSSAELCNVSLNNVLLVKLNNNLIQQLVVTDEDKQQ